MPFSYETRLRPVLKWVGGKSASLPEILSRFQFSFRRYFEPFMGGGAVFLALDDGTPAYLNDANRDLISLYRVLRDEPLKLMKTLDEFSGQYSETFYYDLRAQEFSDRILRAARFLFLNKTGYNGLYRINSKGKFNVPFGKRLRCPKLYQPENWTLVSKRLKRAHLYSGDFTTLISKAGPGDFIYCDPPYEPLSATSCFRSYIARGFTWEDQVRLKNACVEAATRGATIAISNSSAPRVLELYQDFPKSLVPVKRAVNSNPHRRGPVHEILAWVSPPGQASSNLASGLTPESKIAEKVVWDEPRKPRSPFLTG